MSLLTTWGYTLPDVDELPNMVETDDFDEFTAKNYAGDKRVEPDITAASAAVRNYCGWHVYPSEACQLNTTFYDRRVSIVYKEILIQLPASYVTEITSIKIGGQDHEDYVLEPNGLLHVFNVHWGNVHRYTSILIDYVAGVPDSLMGAIKELIAHRVTHALASSAGVQSETAGGVSITYNAGWVNSARATALADDNKEVLAPYRIQGVF